MKKIISFIVQKRRLFFLLSLLIASLVVSLKFSSYSWAINPTIKKDGYVKITNIKNGDIIPNKKDIVVEYSADSMTMPVRGVRYIGRIRYLILTVNGEPYGTYENTQDKGTYTFQIDLSKLDDETPVKLQALGYLHTAPKSLIRLWEQKRMKIDQLQNFLKNLAQFKSEELGISKDNNPFDLPKNVNPDDLMQDQINDGWVDPTIREPDTGSLRWIKYEWGGQANSSVPKFTIEFPSIWRKLGEGGGIVFTKPNTTTAVSINTSPIPPEKEGSAYLQEIISKSVTEGYTCDHITIDGFVGSLCTGISKGSPYVHEGDKRQIILFPYKNDVIFKISFLNDKTAQDDSSIWKHMYNSFDIIE